MNLVIIMHTSNLSLWSIINQLVLTHEVQLRFQSVNIIGYKLFIWKLFVISLGCRASKLISCSVGSWIRRLYLYLFELFLKVIVFIGWKTLLVLTHSWLQINSCLWGLLLNMMVLFDVASRCYQSIVRAVSLSLLNHALNYTL